MAEISELKTIQPTFKKAYRNNPYKSATREVPPENLGRQLNRLKLQALLKFRLIS
jgi:hypothetical protein